jgi:hypothetical protein
MKVSPHTAQFFFLLQTIIPTVFRSHVGEPYLGITSRLPVIHPRRNSDCVGTLADVSLLGYGLHVAIQNHERCRIPPYAADWVSRPLQLLTGHFGFSRIDTGAVRRAVFVQWNYIRGFLHAVPNWSAVPTRVPPYLGWRLRSAGNKNLIGLVYVIRTRSRSSEL